VANSYRMAAWVFLVVGGWAAVMSAAALIA
jgi:hypothetical protein